jgi:hypothetical protein
MKTDELIEALARDPAAPAGASRTTRLAVALATGLALALAVVALGPGLREDIAGAGRMPAMMKAGFAAAAASVALPLLMRLARPGAPLGWRLVAVGGFFALAALITLVALMGGDPGERFALWMGGAFPWCVVTIPLLAAPTAALLAWVLRDFAPTRLAMSGAALGAVSGGVGAMAYAMYCPVDSAAFVATWYALAIALCAAIGAVLGSRLLRW